MRAESIEQIKQAMQPQVPFMSAPEAAVYIVSTLAMGDKNFGALTGSVVWQGQRWELSDTTIYVALEPLMQAGIISDYRKPLPERGRPWRMFTIADTAKAANFIAGCLQGDGHVQAA